MGQRRMKYALKLKTSFKLKLNKKEIKLYLSFFLSSLIPAIWILVRTLIITKYMNLSLNTYAQWEYINVMFEIMQEAFIFPIFFFMGKIKNNSVNDLNKIRQIYFFVSLIYFLIIFSISFFTSDLVKIIDGHNYLNQATFFILQLYAKIPEILLLVSTIFLLNIGKHKAFFLLLIVRIIIFISFDFTLTNGSIFQNPYLGLGLSSILTYSILFIFSLLLIAKFFSYKNFFNLKTFKLTKLEFNRIFFWNFLFTFIASAINNLFYLLVIAKSLNMLDTSGSYWLANQLIWNWILLPITALIELFKVKIAIATNEGDNVNKKFKKYFFVASFLFLIPALLICLLWIPFASFLSNNETEIIQSFKIMKIVIWFYLFYAWSSLIEALFIGTGILNFLLIKSILVNFTVYLIPFILFKINYWIISIETIALIFSLSLLLSFLVNITLYFLILKHNKLYNLLKRA